MKIHGSLLDKIDHIVLAVPDLDHGIAYITGLTGAAPSIGGRHPQHGTQNAILSLGPKCYLEILSTDPSNTDAQTPRWMAVDQIQAPTITRWCVRSSDLKREAKIIEKQILKGNRITKSGAHLRWEMTDPLSSPIVDTIPFLIDWTGSHSHPADDLPQLCTIKSIDIDSSQSSATQKIFDLLQLDTPVSQSPRDQIKLKLNTPNGLVIL